MSHCCLSSESADVAKERFDKALERDYFMTAEKALEFGIVDKIVEKRENVEGEEKSKALRT